MSDTPKLPPPPAARFRWNWLPGFGNLLVGLFLLVSVHLEDLKAWWKVAEVAAPSVGSKAAEFNHAMTLPVRSAKEADFTPETKRWGIEVYRDPHTGQLIYITERGQIQTIPVPK